MVQRRFFICAIALALSAAAAPRPAAAQSADEVFDATTLHEVRLLINSKDLQLLRANFTENTYYPADMVWGSERVRNVGVRSRGAAFAVRAELARRRALSGRPRDFARPATRHVPRRRPWSRPSCSHEKRGAGQRQGRSL